VSISSGHNCHVGGTRVMMYDGETKAVEDVNEGDLLMGDDGTPREVLELYRGSMIYTSSSTRMASVTG